MSLDYVEMKSPCKICGAMDPRHFHYIAELSLIVNADGTTYPAGQEHKLRKPEQLSLPGI